MATEEMIPLAVRIPRSTHEALLERQRQATASAGAEVQLAAVVRALLEEGLKKKSRK